MGRSTRLGHPQCPLLHVDAKPDGTFLKQALSKWTLNRGACFQVEACSICAELSGNIWQSDQGSAIAKLGAVTQIECSGRFTESALSIHLYSVQHHGDYSQARVHHQKAFADRKHVVRYKSRSGICASLSHKTHIINDCCSREAISGRLQCSFS